MGDADWKEGLTAEQIAIVERATKEGVTAAGLDWETRSDDSRARCCKQILAALRKSDHPAFPAPPPAKSRGEVVAEQMVRRRNDGVEAFHPVDPSRAIFIDEAEGTFDTDGFLRTYIAAAIDAAYAEGVEDAAKVADEYASVPAAEIRALAAKGVSK